MTRVTLSDTETLSTKNPTRIGLELDPTLRCGRSASNCVISGSVVFGEERLLGWLFGCLFVCLDDYFVDWVGDC
jgi:hypothetical protein